ncbi:MAG: ATP-binding protein [Verrucomicrobia bacterium]|nr:ATP-binding protein [Verrucomicrobiota bacterium]
MSDKIDTKNHPTVKALIEHRDRLNISDTILSRRYIGISKTTWSQLQSGTYPAQDPSPMLEKCEAALQVLIDEAERADTTGGNKGTIIDLPHIKAAIAGIKGCYGVPQNRLVVYLADTGGGKTTLALKLQQTYRSAAICGEAGETWRGSYLNAASDVAEWIGLDEEFTNPRAAERAVIDALAVTPRIVVIDECHYCGPQALNFIKAILNKTTSRVVMVAMPQLWARMEQKAYDEARQLRRRTHAKIVVEKVEASDCRKFLAARLPGYDAKAGDEKEIVAVCVAAANRFGLYDTLERICAEVGSEGAGKDASLDVVTAAIKRVEALRS